ncbi:MAG: acetylglutamate kinase [Phycisphaeraceae bacterium]|nr:acetylglutamate kinase [Phycisphaeraceae bacterium]
MDNAISKAEALVEAHQYIRRFENEIVVVKVGGSIMDDPSAMRSLLTDICFLDAVGMRPVVVHGGGKSITDAMKQAGLDAHFVQGRRYTDDRTLAIAEHVLVNQINRQMVEIMTDLGHHPMPMTSLTSCAVFARKLFLQDARDPAKNRIDIGLVGEVDWVNHSLLKALCAAGHVPVIAPIARDQAGGKLNVNADSVAGHVAAAVKAVKLVLVSDTHGIRLRADDPDSLATTLNREQVVELIDQGTIGAGMLPKVEAAMTALEGGVGKAHIIDGRIPHSLLLEVYTDTGIGTELVL